MVNNTDANLDDTFTHQMIRASAGTGKTFALSNRYLKLLVAGVECQSILATTFSRKGAGEILDRIIGRLSDAALDPQAAQRLSQELDVELDQPRAAKILHQLLANLHRLEVSTLDSFFNRVAKAFSLELGLPPTWEIVEEQQIAQMVDEAIQQVLISSAVNNLLSMLSRGEATRRVASMVRDVVGQVYSIYRESGPEPWDRLQSIGQRMPDEQYDGLLDAIENINVPGKQLAKHWETIQQAAAADHWQEIVDSTSFQNVVDGNPKFGRTKLPPEILQIYQQLIPHYQALICEQLIARNRATRDLLEMFGQRLERAKDQTGNLRFDDVTERLEDFVQMWDTERFAFRLDHQIQHLLLDEFQDTSPAQWNVVSPFAQRVVQDQSGQRSFFCVGDMKQAIFGWRGGVAEIFDLVDRSLPNLTQSTLVKSYRSSPEVIGLINDVFGNVSEYRCGDPLIDEAIQQWPAWFSEHSTARTELDGYVSIEMASDCDAQSRKMLDRKDRLRNENVTEATIQRVRQLVREMPEHTSIGVLVRTNREIGELIFRLRQKGVEVSEEGGSPLTDSAAVELILSAIQLADHPGDGLARFHVSHSPLASMFGLHPEDDSNQSENVAAAQLGAAKLRRRLVDEGFGTVVESMARLLVDQATARETKRLQQLVRVAYDYAEAERWNLRPARFVQFVREDVKVSDESGARVRVMTIHRAKGLEFDAVVLPYPLTSEGWAGQTPNVVVGRDSPTAPINIASRYAGEKSRKLLPQQFQELFEADRQRNVREAMCVLYVALTRAVHAVHIIVSFSAKPTHKSPAGILLATLCPERREEGLLYESGNRLWYQSSQPPAADDDPYGLTDFYLPADVELHPGGLSREPQSGRGLPTVSPTQVAGGTHVKLDQLFESRRQEQAITRGHQIHACFEAIRWLDDGVPDANTLRQQLVRVDHSASDFSDVLDEFYSLIEQPTLKKLFSRQLYQAQYLPDLAVQDELAQEETRLVVHTERRYAVETPEGFSRGIIDRLILVYRGQELISADIIDLKTDQISSEGLHQRVAQYRPQLAAYRSAAAAFLNLPASRIATRLVFTQTGQVVNLDVVESSIDSRQQPGSRASKSSRRVPRQPKLNRQPPEPPAAPPSTSQHRHDAGQTDQQPPAKRHRRTGKVQRTLWED